MAQTQQAPKRQETYMKVTRVRNQEPAPIQITAEQLVMQAQAYVIEDLPPPSLNILDQDELIDYKYRMRKAYQEEIRRQKHHIGTWRKYAKMEALMGEFQRSRSVFERALEIDPYDTRLIEDYVEMEMKHKFVDHAWNIWQRAIKRLPGTQKFWLKYAEMQIRLGNYLSARDIYSSWISHNPSQHAWDTFLKFQQKLGELQNCRQILKDYIDLNPSLACYLKAAKFQAKYGNKVLARSYFERAFLQLGDKAIDQQFILQFCEFQTKCKEYDRARVLFNFGIDKLGGKDGTQKSFQLLNKKFVQFQKQFGRTENIDEVIYSKRRTMYQRQIQEEGQVCYKYDLWLDLAFLQEQLFQIRRNDESLQKVREIYERGIACIPPNGAKKEHWKKYMWIWVNYAMFQELSPVTTSAEELKAKLDRVEEIYKQAIEIVPKQPANQQLEGQAVTIARIWVMYADFQLRCQNLDKARKIYGTAIGKCPTRKLLREYAKMESKFGNIQRSRKIFQRGIEIFCQKGKFWPYIDYAEFERDQQEFERARGIFQIAINQMSKVVQDNDVSDAQLVWRKYIEFEIQLRQFNNARTLYQRLVNVSHGHLKVWMSYALFQKESVMDINKCREVFQRGNMMLRDEAKKCKNIQLALENKRKDEQLAQIQESRSILLQKWLSIEKQNKDPEWTSKVRKKQPTKIRKRRKIQIGSDDNRLGKDDKEDQKAQQVEIGEIKQGEGGQDQNKKTQLEQLQDTKNLNIGWQQYVEYIFPEDAQDETDLDNKRKLKFLEKVKKWKKDQKKID